VAGEHVVTAAEGSVVLTLDHEPALSVLLDDLGVADQDPRRALPLLRQTLAGLSDAGTELLARGKQFGEAVRVRHLVGLDPLRHGVAVAERMQPGMRLAFSRRDREAAQRDLVRICSEIREELDGDETQPPRPARGAVYVSCSGRGGHHFGSPSAELKIIQRALGEVPLVGFFAAGEIAHQQLYGYTGVLTVFT
jgi:small ligand-binding sensory domain FIST